MNEHAPLMGAAFAAEHAPDALLVVDSDATLRWASPSAQALLGYDPIAHAGTNVFEKVHPDDLGYAAGALHETARKDGIHIPVEIRVAHADGHWVDVEITANTPTTADGTRRIVLSLRPLDPRNVLPGRRRDFEDLLKRTSQRCAGATWQAVSGIVTDALAEAGNFFHAFRAFIAIVDHDDDSLDVVSEWSARATGRVPPALGAITLGDLGPVEGSGALDFTYAESADHLPGPAAARLRRAGVRSQLVVPVAPDGVLLAVLVVHWAESADQRWDDALGTYVGAFAQILTATLQRSRGEAAVHHRSLHDPLTGLPNRTQLLADLRQALGRLDPESPGGLAVLYCDLDGFKRINDEHGHEAGDRSLIDVANRIRSQLRPGDLVSRIGGDEFVVVCRRVESPERARDVVDRIRTAVTSRAPSGATEPIDVSIGIAWTSGPCDPDQLLREADLEMYRVKQRHHPLPQRA